VVLAAPRRQSPLRRLKNAPGVVGYFAGEDIAEDEMRALLDQIDRPTVILVDDAEILRQCDASDVLTSVVRRSTGKPVGVVIAGDADDVCGGFSGWQVEMKKSRSGLLLSPQNMSDADLIGVRLQRGSIGNAVQPGRGLLHLGDGEVRTVQVPLTAL
jgi:DNA segregation ATPase FtsK/SpoIIIE, S-DNA-T family